MSTQHHHLGYYQHWASFSPWCTCHSLTDGFSSHPDSQSPVHSSVLSGMSQGFPDYPKLSGLISWLSPAVWNGSSSSSRVLLGTTDVLLLEWFLLFLHLFPTHASSQKQTGAPWDQRLSLLSRPSSLLLSKLPAHTWWVKGTGARA